MGTDDVLRRCIPEHEREDVINEAHTDQLGVTSRPTRQPERYCKQACGGRLYINTVRIKLENVIVVKGLGDLCGKMKCLSVQ
jgi:hypothetical protein